MNRKNIFKALIISAIYFLIMGCSKDNNFIIPLTINNINIEEIEKKGNELIFKAEYKDAQTLECSIEHFFLLTDELKITGMGASYYNGKIKLSITTNNVWGDENFKIVPYRISFDLSSFGLSGLNRRKCEINLNLNNYGATVEVQ